MRFLRGVFALLGGWVSLLGCVCVLLVLLPFLNRKRRHLLFARVANTFGRMGMWLVGARLVEENAPSYEGRAGRVIVMNHQSALDLAIGARLLPPGVTIIAKKEIAWVPLLNLVWWFMEFIFVDRKDSQKAQAAVAEIPEKLKSGNRTLLIAPEGTRSASGELLPFKMGAFHMAQQAGVPIHPVVFDGAHKAWPKGRILPGPGGEVRLRYLTPVDTTDWLPDDVREKAEEIHNAMQDALDAWRKQD
jgi:1-acyl-sn-glycerol-3-phosphate acyltransferase